MKERIQHIIKAESLTNLQFAQLIESSPATVTHLLSGRNKPSIEMVANIARAFPHYNLRWLILGEGAIYNRGVDEAFSCASEAQNSATLSNELPFDATDAPNSANVVQSQQTVVITPVQLQSPEVPATPIQNVATTSSETVTAPEPSSPTKLIVCLPDGTFSEYTRK